MMKQKAMKPRKIWSLALLGLIFGVLLSSCNQVNPGNMSLESQIHTIPDLKGIDHQQIILE